MKFKLLLILILLLASVLRLYRLGEVPLGLFGDEIDAGYQSYSLWKTGRDYHGNFIPVHFESIGDFRPGGFFVALVPSIAAFGLSDFSVRLPSALFGILGIYLVYLISNLAFKDSTPKIGYLTALLLAITPWHLHFSRVALDSGLMVNVILLGVYLGLKAAQTKSKVSGWWWGASALVFALNAYIYQVGKLFSPWLFLVMLVIYRKNLLKLPKKILVVIVVVFSLLLTPLIYDSLYGPGQSRFRDISIFNEAKLAEKINYARGQLPSFLVPTQRWWHNKLISIAYEAGNNYLEAWSPNFLFISGEVNQPRHSLPGFGLLYFWMGPFLLWGLVALWKIRQQPFSQFLLTWLLLAPIPSALTSEGGQHAIRLFIMSPPLIMIISLGFYELIRLKTNRVYKKILWYSLSTIIIITFIFYLERYYIHYSPSHFRHWQYGLKPAIYFAITEEDKYEQIIITRSYVHLPMIYYLFYAQIDPEKVQQQFALNALGQAPPPTDQVGKYRFATINPGDVYHPSKTLYIAASNDRTEGWYQIGEIKSPDPMDDKPILLILSSDPPNL